MKKIIYLIGLSVVFASCFKKQKSNNIEAKEVISTSITLDTTSDSTTTEKEYFSNIEEFKKFIYIKKWIDLADEAPCHEYARSITIKDGYFYEYNGIEPSECKIEKVKQLDSKTLEITIEDNCNYGSIFKVEILDYAQHLVRWTIFKGQTFNAKPYVDFCQKTHKKEQPYYEKLYNTSKSELTVNDKWEGLYYHMSNQTGKEFILDTRNQINLEVGGDQYGYIDQLKLVKVGDTLGLYHHKNISGANYDDTRSYDFLKFYKSSNGKFYFEGKLPYLPEGAIEFEKVK